MEAPNQTWVSDITYIRTYEGFLYLAVVVDLFSRRVVGWSMQPTMSRDLVIQALLFAVWRRRPSGTVLVHSDQGSQYGSHDYLAFLEETRPGAVDEPAGQLPGQCRRGEFLLDVKKLRIRRRIYATRDDAGFYRVVLQLEEAA